MHAQGWCDAETILLLQDNASKAAIVRETLVKSSDPPLSSNGSEVVPPRLDRLHDQTRDHITAVLIDLLLPDGQELEIFDQIFQHRPHSDLGTPAIRSTRRLPDKPYSAERKTTSWITASTAIHCRRLCATCSKRTANAEALFMEKERAQVTLNSIGDGVISTDVAGNVTYLNPVAEAMTAGPAPSIRPVVWRGVPNYRQHRS